MKLVEIRGEREVFGLNAHMKRVIDKAPRDKREGYSLTAPKLALQLSEPGHKGLFLLKRRG